MFSLSNVPRSRAVFGCPVWRLIKTHDQGFRRSIMKRKLMTFQCIPSIIGDSIPMKEIVFITYVIVDGWTGIAGDIEPGHGLGATRLVTSRIQDMESGKLIIHYGQLIGDVSWIWRNSSNQRYSLMLLAPRRPSFQHLLNY
ncbi:uncharacterized protein LOC110437033 isoform X3 [Sorghum bicolor]|uniref:uncharacterized protein LOC110437033 isoform X3 n=1 Tax=Sorghum bicolor TaxID=4558 RepID=UPI000B425577|nr:uncharacterized protein LOC110437033 isoform X3 [Sorghum bicolor]|eukprot:XP_021320751.1 uncharacterized protein LOC110437033 isoform X3 [Sorghum bicolor]